MVRFLEGAMPASGPERSRAGGPLLTLREYAALQRAPRTASPARGADGWSPSELGAAEGLSAYVAGNGARAEHVRMRYDDTAHRLAPDASADRAALKFADRQRTPAPQRAYIRKVRPGTAAPKGTSGSANHTNPRVSEQARALGRMGRASAGLAALLGVGEVLAADDKVRAGAAVTGAMAGGWAGGVAGAESGGLLGAPFGPWTAAGGALIGGIGGAMGGGSVGHAAGGHLVDRLRSGRRP